MPLIVPVSANSDPLYRERVRLDERDFILRFDWNGRDNRIYLYIYDQSEKPLLLGIKLVANWPILKRHKWNPALPQGELFAMDLEQGGEPPVLGELGKRVKLVYFTPAELAALPAAVASA